ncbi:hypothetical protein CQW23_13042 [Capsicum baccatum]|uniref:Uncharacterized protein n=1 Tax=Capsicum baccatum TaxID=33114 RepID=A0A2G2WUB1_CAPBA|nr:hypothetical protein CQW23_13042 [Capsicum baccatum]
MWLKKVFLIFATLFYWFSLVGGCYEGERAALMSFKSVLTDPSNRLSSWQGENCCTWKGIKCSSSGHVVVVNLRNPHPIEVKININKEVVSNSKNTSDFALKGTISPLLFTLDHIQHLDLSYNNFMFSKFPAEISNLTKLTYLNLSNAMFQDSIAMQFTNLTSLRSLDLSCANLVPDYSSVSVSLAFPLKLDFGSSLLSFISYGYLSSPNLRWLEGLRRLRYLVLTGVDLSKASESVHWAKPISSLSNLMSLHLSNCNISGRIPIAQFLNLTNIASLDMSSNVLKSSIPDLLSNITTLSVLDFSRNDLNGHIPYLPQLEELSVASNPAVTIDLVSMFAVPWSKLTLLDICFTRVGGMIPPSLSNSTSLTFFRADGCSIQGSIPSSITKLKKLSVLMLNENDITGQLPVSMSSLTTLQYLSMFQNRLEGNIPISICKISSLEYLNLEWNDLTGRLPLCIIQLPTLSSLYIQRNRLNGNMPFSLFRKSRLAEISLGTSGLSVEIDDPDQPFAQIFQPKILDFTSCNMRGEIPDFFSNFTSLVVLNFANNSLSGAIPQWLFNLPALSILALPMNNFIGFIPPMIHLKSSLFPTMIGEAPGIRSISLSRNKIRGSLPESFCHASNVLQVLDLSTNSLSGTIRRNLGNCRSLIYLNLGQNNLTGSVPEELKHITSLRYLDLHGNQFEGSFPAVIENFQDLEILNLAGNRFEGKIPKFIGDLRSLRILVLESNSFNESIPEGLMKLENLQYIGLSRNNLSSPIPENLDGLKMMAERQNEETILGKIPEKIGLLSGIPFLNLSRNNLSGTIPKTIGEMISLESLDFSYNHFTGEIPVTLTLLDFLQHLNMSYNNLSGEIPRNPHFDTLYQDGTTYIGNKYLCGAPDGMDCSNLTPSITEKIEEKYDQENFLFVLVIFFGYATGISGLFLLLYLMKDEWRSRFLMMMVISVVGTLSMSM